MNEETSLQSAPILVLGMELWKSLGAIVTSKITFALLRPVTSNLNVTKSNTVVFGRMMGENSWQHCLQL